MVVTTKPPKEEQREGGRKKERETGKGGERNSLIMVLPLVIYFSSFSLISCNFTLKYLGINLTLFILFSTHGTLLT